MSRGIKIAIIALIIVIILAAIIFLIWALLTKPPILFKPAAAPPTVEEPATAVPDTGGTIVEVSPGVGTEEATLPFEIGETEEIEKQKAKSTAILFVERFGSFSNQGDFQNVEDLMPLMTSVMQSWAGSYIDQGRAAEDADGAYYGVTTKALTAAFVSFDLDAGLAELNIDTQRQETGDQVDPRTYYQTMNVSLLKSNNQWLIQSAAWQ